MAIEPFLAMTGAEIRTNTALPPKIAWFSCHFSPCGTGLSNLPSALPAGSMLILDDSVPIRHHDPQRILAQLWTLMEKNPYDSLLLDFQRPGEPETAALAALLYEALPCPVGISDLYAQGLPCPVFLPPAPLDARLSGYLEPWTGREIWLEAALDGTVITLTEHGAASAPLPPGEMPEGGRREDTLHCHYTIVPGDKQVTFTLSRTPEDLSALLEEAEGLGIARAIGLYQELGPVYKDIIISGCPPQRLC